MNPDGDPPQNIPDTTQPTVEVIESTAESVAQELTQAIRYFHQQGWTPATSSNFSFRHPQAPMIACLSKSGLDKGTFSHLDFVGVDPQGQPVAEELQGVKPSAETPIHLWLYQKDPDIGVVCHTHSVLGTLLSRRLQRQGGITFAGYEILKGLSGTTTHHTETRLPIFPNTQDMMGLAQELDTYYSAHPLGHGLLLAGHGLYTWGHTVADAKRHIEVFEFLFQCLWHDLALPRRIQE